MDFVATREDVALVRREIEGTRTEIEGTRTEIAKTNAHIDSMQGELLTRMAGMETKMVAAIADVKTLVANREASMHRWLLGVTATAMIGVTTALIRTFA